MKKKNFLTIALCMSIICGAIPPIKSADAVTTADFSNVTLEELKSLQNFILNNSDGVTIKIDKHFDVNNDNKVDVFDFCILKNMYIEQNKSSGNFYSLSSQMVQKNDKKYGMSIMADDFYSKRLIVKAKKAYDFSKFSPQNVISGGDYIYVLQFDSVESAETCMNTLKNDSNIVYYELDSYIKCDEITTNQSKSSNSWGVSAIEADQYAEYLSKNCDSSVVVAVVDTGVASHDFLAGRIINGGYDLVDNDSDPTDKHYHGTHVAGIVVDCTPELNVNILPVRVLDADGYGSNLNIGNGIKYAAENGADIINLSLGGSSCSKYIEDAIDYAVGKGVTVVVAAGNKGNNTADYCPAHLDNVIVVAACDSENKKADFSNYGQSVDVTAPGVGINSCIPGGSYKVCDGTSMAAPHISAAAAMIKYSNNSATPAQIEQTIKDISIDLGDKGKDVYFGYGLPKLSSLIPGDNSDIIEDNSDIIEEGKCGDDVYYTLSRNGLLTISGTGKMDDPLLYEKTPFYKNGYVKEIIIKDGVTTTGMYAFAYCSNLKSVTILGDFEYLGSSAFSGCSNLKSIKFSGNIKGIGSFAFDNCSSLESVEFGSKLRGVTGIGDRAFFGCTGLKSIIIPESVKSIGTSAFANCSNLESIFILNLECEIGGYIAEGAIPETTTIYGYSGSTAEKYAKSYNRKFIALD